MADPKHPERLDDPESIPVLTDVIVPGRPPTPRYSEAHAPAVPQRAEEAPAAPQTSAQPAGSAPAATAAPPAVGEAGEAGEAGAQAGTPVRAATEPARESFERRETEESAQRGPGAEPSGFVTAQPASAARPPEPHRSTDPLQSAEPPNSPTPPKPADPMAAHPAEWTERDADHIAERLRGRFADYLREEGRRVIEARCREALDDHASWLIRQVTREVAHALEGEVAGWVRDAVRAELAARQSKLG